jgi:hypothetical protein
LAVGRGRVYRYLSAQHRDGRYRSRADEIFQRRRKHAYWLSRFLEDYDTTQAAKNESLALERELSYWIGRGYSDDAAIAKIDYADYPTLAKMREAQGVGEPLQLTEALPFSDDWLYAKAWAARNPDTATGDYMTDLMQMGMGHGVAYKPDPQSDAARDPSNAEAYNPYMFGATNDGLRMKYGVDSWDMDWLEQNRSMLADEATADDWRAMYDAAQNTATARAELEALQTKIAGYIADGRSFEEIFGKKLHLISAQIIRRLRRWRTTAIRGRLSSCRIPWTLPSPTSSNGCATRSKNATRESVKRTIPLRRIRKRRQRQRHPPTRKRRGRKRLSPTSNRKCACCSAQK